MHDAQTAAQHPAPDGRPTPLPLRDDTLLGVCEALGEDFGFNPLWLRIALAVGLLWNAYAIVGIYLAAAVIVGASRLLFPKPRVAAASANASAEPALHRAEADQPELPLAA
jgi:phage shock protein C